MMLLRSAFLLSFLAAAVALKIDYDQIKAGKEADLIGSVAILIGTALAFFGLRLYKPALFIVAFSAAFAVSFHFLDEHIDQAAKLYGICAAVGAVAGVGALSIVSFGAVVIGLCAGALVAYVSYVAFLHYMPQSDNHVLLYCVVSVAGLAGSYLGHKAFRIVILGATALCGSFMVVSGIDLLTDRQLTPSNVEHKDLNKLGWALLGIWVFLSIAGVVFQIRQTRTKKPKRASLTTPLHTEHSSLVHASGPGIHKL